MEDVLNIIAESLVGSLCVQTMVDAHQSLDYGFLQDFGVVVVIDVKNSLNGEEDDVHNSF